MDTGYRYKSRSAHAQHSAQDGGYRRHQIVRSRDRQRSLWLAVEASCPTSVCGKETFNSSYYRAVYGLWQGSLWRRLPSWTNSSVSLE